MRSVPVARKNGPLELKGVRKTYLYLRRANRIRVILFFSASILLVVLVFLFGYLFIQDVASSGKIFSGVTIDGQSVGGLTRAQAKKVVEQKTAGPLNEPLVVFHDDSEVTLDPGSVDFKVDVSKMVDLAYWTGQDQGIASRMWRRFFKEPYHKDIPVLMTYDKKKLDTFVKDVAGELDYPPESASIDVSKGSPRIVNSEKGLEVQQEDSVKAISQAISKHERRVPLVTESPVPEVTERDIGMIVLIKQAERKLYLYDGEDFFNSYMIAVGMPEYPTPNGRFHITYKEKNPTWLPTSEWAKDKQGIPVPPGPDNPLGGYWMDLGGGIGIHATPFPKSLGEAASHGCIRMADWAAEELFNKVKVGTPVFIVE